MVLPFPLHFPFAILRLDTFPRLEPCTTTDGGDHREARVGGQEQGTCNGSCWRESLKAWPASNTLQKNTRLPARPHPSRVHNCSPGLMEWNVYSVNRSNAEVGTDTQHCQHQRAKQNTKHQGLLIAKCLAPTGSRRLSTETANGDRPSQGLQGQAFTGIYILNLRVKVVLPSCIGPDQDILNCRL